MVLGWVRFGRAPGHGNGAKDRLTDWLRGWFDLVFILPPHFIFFHLYKSLIERMEALSMCVCTMFTYVCVFTSMTGSFHRNTHPHLSMAFHRLPACLALPSPVCIFCSCSYIGERMWQMFLQCMKAILLHLKPQVVQCFFNTAQKQVPLVCLLKLFTDEQNSLLLLLLFPLASLFPALFLTVWDTTLCEFRKAQRYCSDFVMCMANGLFWMVLKLNVLTGSCMYGMQTSRDVWLQVSIKIGMFHFWKGKLLMHVCARKRAHTYMCVHACEWIGAPAYSAFENLKVGAARSVGSAWRWWIHWLAHMKTGLTVTGWSESIVLFDWMREDMMTAVSHCDRPGMYSVKCAI